MKVFNTTVSCVPSKHYMIDTSNRIHTIISSYIDQGKYFVINRARQYGKTTTLQALKRTLKSKYYVLSISFAGRPSMFKNEQTFVNGFVRKLHIAMKQIGMDKELFSVPTDSENPLEDLSEAITELCDTSDKEIVLMPTGLHSRFMIILPVTLIWCLKSAGCSTIRYGRRMSSKQKMLRGLSLVSKELLSCW